MWKTAAVPLILCLAAAPAAPQDATAIPEAESPAATPFEAAYQFALAKMLAEESDFRAAQKAFERALELDGSDAYTFLEVAKFHYELAFLSRSPERRRQQLLEAADYAAEALRLAPEARDVLFQFAQIHFRLGEHQLASLDLAQETFEKLRRKTEGDVQVLMALGQIHFMKRQPEQAAEVLEEAASYLPNHRMIQSMLVESLFAAGRVDDAEVALDKLLLIDPSNLEERLRLAEVRREKGDARGAVEVLEAAPADVRDDPRLRQALARGLFLTGDNEAALRLVDGLLEERSDPGELGRLKASILTSMARYREAIATLEPLLAAGDEPSRRLQDSVILSRLYERVGNADEAVARLRVELLESPDSVQLKLALAGVLERHGRVEEAIGTLESEIADAGPQESAVFASALAEMLERSERPDEALRVLDQAAAKAREGGQEEAIAGLELRRLTLLASAERWGDLVTSAAALLEHENGELRAAARRLRAQGLAELGRVDEALELVDPAGAESDEERRMLAARVGILFDHGRDDEARNLLTDLAADGGADDLFFAARLFQRAERFEPVVELMRRLLEQNPESLQALFLLGSAHERQGTRADSIDAFQRLLALEPDHAPTLNYLGYMWAERGENLDQALGLVLRAVALDPDNGAYVDSLGWVLYQLGRYDQAREHLEWAARLLPSDPTIFEHLGDLYLKLDEISRARDSYRQALELESDNLDEVRRKLESLDGKGP